MSPSFRRLCPLALLSALAFAPGCNKAPAPDTGDKQAPEAPAAPAEPVRIDAPETPPEPPPLPTKPVVNQDSDAVTEIGEVVATVQIPTGTAMTDIAAVAEMVQPKISILLAMQAPRMLEDIVGLKLRGAKLDGPLSMVMLDPNAHTEPFALLVTVDDAEALSAAADKAGAGYEARDGLALVGPKDVVAAASDYAFANLSKVPDHSEIILYPGPMMAAAGPLIDATLDDLRAEFEGPGNAAMLGQIELLRTGASKLVEQSARIVVSVSPSAAGADLAVHLYPTAESLLAAFIAAQKPSQHELLAKLPQLGTPSAVISGEIHSGPAHDELVALFNEMVAELYEADLDSQGWAKQVLAWLDTTDGRVAALVDANGMLTGQGGMKLNVLLGSADADQMRKVWRELFTAFVATSNKAEAPAEPGAPTITLDFTPESRAHEGVAIDLFKTTLDLSSLPAEQRALLEGMGAGEQGLELAAFDQFGAMASTEAGGSLTPMIDATRGKAPTFTPSATLDAMLSEAKNRGESMIYFMDIAAMAPPGTEAPPFTGFAAGLGRLGEALSIRVSLRK